MNEAELAAFAAQIAGLELTQFELATAVLWFHDHHVRDVELPVSDIVDTLRELGLVPANANRSRIADALPRSRQVIRGRTPLSFRISAKGRHELDQTYLPLLKTKNVTVEDNLIPAATVQGTRPYLEKLVHQINGTYQYQFFDGCAALSRRLVESLLIEAFAKAGHDDKIREPPDNHYKMLAGIIAEAKSGRYIRLSRNAPNTLDLVKKVGDRAAHDKHYITKKVDLDAVAHDYRALIEELLHLAGIHPAGAT